MSAGANTADQWACSWVAPGARGPVLRFEATFSIPLGSEAGSDASGEAWWQRRLQLVRGIGPQRARRLRDRGFDRLPDLLLHPVYAARAQAVLGWIASRDVPSLRRCGARDGELSRLFEPCEVAVFDIETLGLAPVFPVILAGFAWREAGNWRVVQLLAPHFDDEPSLLVGMDQVASRFAALVTYNGRAFDLPYVRMRRAYHGLAGENPWPAAFCLDLLGEARRRLRPAAGSARLRAVEALLFGEARTDDIPAEAIPEYYHRFVQTGDPAWAQPIVAHNRNDLRAIAAVWQAAGMGAQ